MAQQQHGDRCRVGLCVRAKAQHHAAGQDVHWGTWVSSAQIYANQAATHLAIPTSFYATKGVEGEFTLTLSAADSNTQTDANDRFTVALLYSA